MKVLTPKIVLWAVASLLVFLALYLLIPIAILVTVLNGAFIGLSVAFIKVYFPSLYYAIKYKQFDRLAQITLSIAMIWSSITVSRCWSFYNRFWGSMSGSANGPVRAFETYLAIIGGILFISASGYNQLLPRFAGVNRELMFLLSFIGGFIAFVLYLTIPVRY